MVDVPPTPCFLEEKKISRTLYLLEYPGKNRLQLKYQGQSLQFYPPPLQVNKVVVISIYTILLL